MTVGEAQQTAERMLGAVGIGSKHIDASLLLEEVTGRPRSYLFAHLEDELPHAQASRFMELVNARRNRTPLVHLTHKREFYGLELYIDEHVLTPRVETEQMVEWAIKYAPRDSKLIDIGTGSGAIAIAIANHRPDLAITATDVTDEALAVAKRNIDDHFVSVELVQSNLFDSVDGSFATVVTNLPYLRDDADLMPEVLKEPAVALFGGEDGLALYRRFLKQLPDHLDRHGYLFTECDPWQHEDLTAEAHQANLVPVEQGYFILGFTRH